MKYICQFSIIAGISFVAELLKTGLPLPVPASIYGLLILFSLLMFRIVRLEQVEDTADFFLAVMPVFFIEPTVALMTAYDIIRGKVAALLIVCFVSTAAANVVTGLVSQAVIRRKRGKETADESE